MYIVLNPIEINLKSVRYTHGNFKQYAVDIYFWLVGF